MRDDPLMRLSGFRLGFAGASGVQPVLHGIDLTVRPGEMVGLVGASGFGKTVTAKYAPGILPRNARLISGEARLPGLDLAGAGDAERAERRARIAYVPQDPRRALNPSFTIGHQMADYLTWAKAGRSLPRSLIPRGSRAKQREVAERAAALPEMVKITDPARVLAADPMQLSGDMRQQIAIAMQGKPQFSVADEPTTALDVTAQKRIVELLQELVERENLAGIHITHDLGVARAMSDRGAVLCQGALVEHGAADQILTAPEHAYTRSLLAAVPAMDGV